MIHRIKIQKTLFPILRSLFSQTDNKRENSESVNDALVETKDSVQLMEDTYEKIKMEGLRDRDITGVDSFQKDILSQNKFDLLNPRIEPKIASISTTMGLELDQNNYLAEINLGKIKVKKENQVFLSEVDPYNIPEYYDIVFDYEKQMTLVGTKTPTQGPATPPTAEMSISTRKAFEEKSQGELSRDILGVQYSPVLNSKIVWKQLLQAIILTYLVSSAMIETFAELDICRKSILQIEEERMKQLQKMKRQSLVNAMMNNPDMKII